MHPVRTIIASSALLVVGVAASVVILATGSHPAAAATAPMPGPAPVASLPGSYGAVAPARVLDTRAGLGAPKAAVQPGGTVKLTVVGKSGVPVTNVSAVLMTVTAIGPTASGTVQVRAGGASGGTSVITFVRGQTMANLVIAPVSASGQTELINRSTGTLQLVGDLSGYYRGGSTQVPGTMQTLSPARLLDTRSGTGAVGPSGTVALTVLGRGGVPSTGVAAVVLNVDAISPTRNGTVTAWPAGGTKPGVSQLSYTAGNTAGILIVARVGAGGVVNLTNNSTGSVQLVADVFGYVPAGTPSAASVLAPVDPVRLLDTRSGLGAPKASVGPGKVVSLQVAGRGGLPSVNIAAVVLTITAVAPAGNGTLTAWGDGQAKPGTANLTYVANQSIADLVVAPVGADGKIEIANNSSTSTQIVADLAGYYRADPHDVVTSTSRYVRNLTGGSSDVTLMQSEGCSDAQAVATGAQNLVLLDIGGQVTVNGGYGVQLSATAQTLTDAQLVAAVNGYADGYVQCRAADDPTYIAIATNNDGNLRTGAAGADWADNVIDPVAAHVAGAAGIVIVGANDIEPDFTGTEAEAEAWTNAYLAATPAPYIFVGAASGCSTTGVGGVCNWDWTQHNFYQLAHGLSPSRILALPQIYYPENAAQWKYISLSGAVGADRISFIGALSEYAACQTAGSGCPTGYLTASASWQALRNAVGSSSAISVQRLPVSTDLRIDVPAGASISAKHVTTAGVTR